MQAAKRTKVAANAKVILHFCRGWRTYDQWKRNYLAEKYNEDQASFMARELIYRERKKFCSLMKNTDFENDNLDDICAILRWVQDFGRTEKRFPLWIYYKATPPEEQATFFHRWITSTKGEWSGKWVNLFNFITFKKSDNPAFLWLMLSETLKYGHDEDWFPIACAVSRQLKDYENMPTFTSLEEVEPKARYHYWWNVVVVQDRFRAQLRTGRQWHTDPAEMIFH